MGFDPRTGCHPSIAAHTSLSAATGQKLYVVHRLDKEVSGVILFAKNADMHRYLNDQFANRAVRKTYLALAHGRLERNGGTIDKPLRTFGSGRVGVDPAKGKLSVTEYTVVERIQCVYLG
ncbi:MAG: RNA pseudouridine synthase [Candidatus Competibacteraceae bacterium]